MEFDQATLAKSLTKYELELLAEYDECRANQAEIDRTVEAMEDVCRRCKRKRKGDVVRGIKKLTARYLDDDEAAALRKMAASHADCQAVNRNTCGNDPWIHMPERALTKALAKRNYQLKLVEEELPLGGRC